MQQKARVKNTSNPTSIREYLAARNTYFSHVKRAKQEHWNSFLKRTDPQSIYKAMAYTKNRIIQPIPQIRFKNGDLADSFKDKCSALKETLFPKPPHGSPFNWDGYTPTETWEYPPLSREELKAACSTLIKGKTPGPDAITQEIITVAYRAAPESFYKVFSPLFSYGYHPQCWREATGAILAKGKPDTADPKSYRVISLLNCLGKITERITAKRLGYIVEISTLLDPSQIGGRR